MAPSVDSNKPEEQQKAPPEGPFDYKEVAISSLKDYNKSNEENGVGNWAPEKYPNYLPTWDSTIKLPPLEPFTHHEPGKAADPTLPHLFPAGEAANSEDLSGNIGAEVHGIQLSALSSAGKDELALFVARKKVVAFRAQDFADLPIPTALAFARHFGRLHIHPTSPAPAGHPEVHLVHRGAGDTTARDFFADRTTSTAWHSDITYEAQPPGTTLLYNLDSPAAGGDTVFSNMVAAHERLSPAFQRLLSGLSAVHSAHEQAAGSVARGSVVRREPVANVHPLVRMHPATGEKALFVNPQFTRKIVGFKKEESDALLKFLFDLIALSADIQARLKWKPGTVVVWDNRVATHTAILDWVDGARRHIARITPQAERPVEAF